MRVLFGALFARLLILLRVIGPYAAIELLLPGGTFIALLYWWYRNRVTLRAVTDAVAESVREIQVPEELFLGPQAAGAPPTLRVQYPNPDSDALTNQVAS